MVVDINKYRKVKDRLLVYGEHHISYDNGKKKNYIFFTLILRSDRYKVNHGRARSLTPSRCRWDCIIR